jgi:hypothetical protein
MPSSHASVRQVKLGPSNSRPASVVSSFMVEAGFIGRLALYSSSGRAAPTSWMYTPTAEGGTPAVSSASRSGAGSNADCAQATPLLRNSPKHAA